MEALEPRQLLSVSPLPATIGQQATGPNSLAGKVVYTKGGHGYTWMNGEWETQRPYESYGGGIVEDFGNEDQDTYFAHYLLQAGATVVPTRPVDHQSNESVIDNSNAYSPSTGGFDEPLGTWTNVTGTEPSAVPYWSNSPTGNDAVNYVTAATSTTQTALARFTADIPVAGYYPVYAWASYGSNRVKDQTFIINYYGGAYEVHVNLQYTGDGWIYLGNYYFQAGVSQTQGSVEVSNQDANSGVVVADAIRFGNGMGDWVPAGAPGPSGQPREEEAALYWDYDSRGWLGPNNRVAQSVVDDGTTNDDYTADFSAADRWATYMNNAALGKPTDRLWISFHSNASNGNGTTRGTLGLINTVPTQNQAWLALTAGTQVQNELYALTGGSSSTTPGYAATWSLNNPPTFTGGYSEISKNVINGEFDATILEVAFHDNNLDAQLLEDPKVRDAVGKAAYHAAILYFDTYGQQTLPNDTGTFSGIYLPEPPTDVRATTDASGEVTISWDPGPSSSGGTGPYGAAATSYRVSTSATGLGFDGGVTTTGTSITFSGLSYTTPTYFQVTAINAGGNSEPSAVVAAKPQPGRTAPILVVNNYSRLDQSGDDQETNINMEVGAEGTAHTVDRVIPTFNNSENYVIEAASAISAYSPNLGIDTCTDAAIANGDISLSNYSAVIWMSGRQSNVDKTFSAAVQPKVSGYLTAGGKMFISGENIGEDLVADNDGSSFYTNTLKASYPQVSGSYSSSDNANTHSASGVTGSIFAGLSLSFSNGTAGVYNVDSPDTVAVPSGVTGDSSALTYSGGTGASAAIQYTSGNTQLVFMGFPFETITTTANQNSVMRDVMNYFHMATVNTLPTPGSPDLNASSDTGSSSTDNLTNLNNSSGKSLSFTVTGVYPGANVVIYSDGAPISSSTAVSGSTVTVTTNGASALVDGTHTITAIESLNNLSTSNATGLSVTIDTTPPTISPAVFNYNMGQSVTYTFGETLSAAPANSSVTITGNGGTVTTAASYNSATNTETYTFPNGILANGNYSATFNGPTISDLAGNTASTRVDSFFFLMADADHNRTVNSSDFAILAANFGKSGVGFSGGDFNYDGVVNALDFNALATNYGASVPASGDLPDAQRSPLAASRMQPLSSASDVIRDAATRLSSSKSSGETSLFADQPIASNSDLTDLLA